MIRKIAPIIGLGFVGVLLLAFVIDLAGFFNDRPAKTAEQLFHKQPRELALASNGPLGRFDRQQVQRGYQVYKEVCAACHGIKLVAFRDLDALGYNEAEIKAEAGQAQVASINPDTGEVATRKAIAADYFPSPYPNDVAARAANNNALPPDLSLMAKARHDGPAYIYSLLTGYQGQPAELLKKFPDLKTPQGLYYNPYFANLNIAMPPPFKGDGQVTYADGKKATVDQMAKDVSAFMVWTAEPKLEVRHRYGMVALAILLFGTVLGYFAYKNVWAEAKRQVALKGPLDPENQAKRTRARQEAGIKGGPR